MEKKYLLTLVVDECPLYLDSSAKKAELERKINLMLKHIWVLRKDFAIRDAKLVLEQVQPKGATPFKRVYSFKTGEWEAPIKVRYKCKFCSVETENLKGFCSKECEEIFERYNRICTVCGKDFLARTSLKYCSEKCENKHKR